MKMFINLHIVANLILYPGAFFIGLLGILGFSKAADRLEQLCTNWFDTQVKIAKGKL
jgi:hypothetical protein